MTKKLQMWDCVICKNTIEGVKDPSDESIKYRNSWCVVCRKTTSQIGRIYDYSPRRERAELDISGNRSS